MADEASLEELREWLTACDPGTPIDPADPRFVDFYRFEHEGRQISLRGEDTEAGLPMLADAIELATDRSCQLFSGFPGTGKSSELRGLKHSLEAKGYVVLLADAGEYLNLRGPLTISELLIVVAAAFGEAADAHAGTSLEKVGYLGRLIEFLHQDVKLDVGVNLPGGVGDLKLGISTNQPFWIQVRDRLAASIGRLRDHAHRFVEDLAKALLARNRGARGIVFIFDSLEKIRSTRPEEFGAVIESVAEVFVTQAELLHFPCHMVYTIPPYVRHLELGTAYTQVTEVLPAIRVHERRGDAPYRPGIDALCEVVRRRIPVARVFGSDETQLRALAMQSGGHVRLLLTFVRDLLQRARRSGLPATPLAIARVVQRHREDAERNLWSERLPLLRDILTYRELPGMSRAQLPVLAGLLDDFTVLCYRNGDGWYDVHPLVRDKLKQLLAREAAGEPT